MLIGYYMDGSVFQRLKLDVIEPAKAKGYKKIWLVGNSMGGYGSVSYVRQYPRDIAGIVLLGPFLGDKKIIQEIPGNCGGLQQWSRWTKQSIPGKVGEGTLEMAQRRRPAEEFLELDQELRSRG